LAIAIMQSMPAKSMKLPAGSTEEDDKDGAESVSSQPGGKAPHVVQVLNVDITEACRGLCRAIVTVAVTPVVMIILFALLIREVHEAALMGMMWVAPVLFLWVILSLFCMKAVQYNQEYQDQRLKCLVEAMVHIRTIKAVAWEKLYFDKLNHLRGLELQTTRLLTILYGCFRGLTCTVPMGMLIASVIWLLRGPDGVSAMQLLMMQRILVGFLTCLAAFCSSACANKEPFTFSRSSRVDPLYASRRILPPSRKWLPFSFRKGSWLW